MVGMSTQTNTKTDYLRETHHEFETAAQEAMAEPHLQKILGKLGDSLGELNRAAWNAFPQSSATREKARAIKDATLSHLDEHLATFEAAVLAQGGHVHWALDGTAACEIIVQLLQQRNATKVVKSKSMTTEEIHLNPALEAAGIETTETDLGEYIIQLAGHRPSHIVGPALHLSTEQIAEILSKPAGERLPAERERLAAFAREQLRAKFAEADAGISGGNFAIAETGTVVIISNEGNARLTTTLPKLLISVVGMEKIIPKLADLPHFLKVLARAATGQKMSVYTSLITGPRREHEIDGPEEWHVVLLDNGRSRILGSPLRESLFCIRCGACLNACPIYRTIGGHAYGGVYSGPIGAVITPLYDGLSANEHLPQASSLCGACQAACPVKIQIPEMLVRLRENLHAEPGKLGYWEHWAYKQWAKTLRSSFWYNFLSWGMSRTVGWWFRKQSWIPKLPGKLHGWTKSRDFPAPAAERFRDWWEKEGKHESP
jgi:L-lactate dehydrogenase complex protein LldF